MRKYLVWLLIALFSLINLSSTADIIYSKKDNAEKTDIIYLKSGKQIEGRVVDRNAEQVKIEVESTKNLAAINLEEPEPVRIEVYQSDEVEKVVLHQSKPTSIFRKVLIGLGCCCLGSAGVLLYLFNEAMSGLASPLG